MSGDGVQEETIKAMWLFQEALRNHVIECHDVVLVVAHFLHQVDRAILFDTVEREVPLDIVLFRLLRRHQLGKPVMFVYEGAVNDRRQRRRIHEYCEQWGFFARTKYRRVEKFFIRCDHCRRYGSDVDCSEGSEPYLRCAYCYDEWGATTARYRDEGTLSDERKNTLSNPWVSTGVMLVVDPRAHPTPAYKKHGLAEGESWRRQRPRRKKWT
jgi:hypothetical protein